MSDAPQGGGQAVSNEAVSPEESAESVINSIDEGNPDAQESVDVEDASDQELEDVVNDEDASEEEVQEAKKELAKRLSLKINGKEREFDLGNDDHLNELREMAQKGEAADQKFQESAKLRKQMEAFVQLMQKDPITALQKLGHNPDEIAEMHMQKRIEEMKKSPEQIAQEKLQKELEDIKKEKERLENEKFEAEQQRVQDEYARQIDGEITESLENSDLPKSPYVVKRIAELLMMGLESGKNVSVKDVLPIAEKQIKDDIRNMFSAMPEEMVEKILGDEVSTKLRKRRINKMKKTPDTASQIKQTGKAEIKAKEGEKEKKPKSAKDFFKDIGNY